MWFRVWVLILLILTPIWKDKDLLGGIKSLCVFFLRLHNPNFSPPLLTSPISKSPTTLAPTELASLGQWVFLLILSKHLAVGSLN